MLDRIGKDVAQRVLRFSCYYMINTLRIKLAHSPVPSMGPYHVADLNGNDQSHIESTSVVFSDRICGLTFLMGVPVLVMLQ